MVQETNLGQDVNGTHQVVSYVDDVSLIGNIIRTVERNADMLLNSCKDIDSLKVPERYEKYLRMRLHKS